MPTRPAVQWHSGSRGRGDHPPLAEPLRINAEIVLTRRADIHVTDQVTHERYVGAVMEEVGADGVTGEIRVTTSSDEGRWWEVRDPDDELVRLTVYQKGARQMVRRLPA